jgi:hypothetical protein
LKIPARNPHLYAITIQLFVSLYAPSGGLGA